MEEERNCLTKLENYPDVLTARMVADILGVGYLKSLELLKSNQFPVMKLRGTYRVTKSQLIEWMNSPGLKTM